MLHQSKSSCGLQIDMIVEQQRAGTGDKGNYSQKNRAYCQ
jgi:hypothetical protein